MRQCARFYATTQQRQQLCIVSTGVVRKAAPWIQRWDVPPHHREATITPQSRHVHATVTLHMTHYSLFETWVLNSCDKFEYSELQIRVKNGTAAQLEARLKSGAWTHDMFLRCDGDWGTGGVTLFEWVMPSLEKMRIVAEHAFRTLSEPQFALHLHVVDVPEDHFMRAAGYASFVPAFVSYITWFKIMRGCQYGAGDTGAAQRPPWTSAGLELLVDYLDVKTPRREAEDGAVYVREALEAMNGVRWFFLNEVMRGTAAWNVVARKRKDFGVKARRLMGARIASMCISQRKVQLAFLDWAEDSEVYAPKHKQDGPGATEPPTSVLRAFQADAHTQAGDIRLPTTKRRRV